MKVGRAEESKTAMSNRNALLGQNYVNMFVRVAH